MRDIYGNAACCIAATAAKDCNGGLFFDREPRGLEPVIVRATWSQDLQSPGFPPPGTYWCSFQWASPLDVDNAPLNQRAWVAQERYLSPRIMHFSAQVLFWECLEHFGNEASPHGLPFTGGYHSSTLPVQTLKLHIRDVHDNISSGEASECADKTTSTSPTTKSKRFYQLWNAFRDTYTECAITKEEDYLVALSGIAQDAGKAMNDHMLAGLWKGNLLKDLCWISHDGYSPTLPLRGSCRPTTWRAPTWSWASSILPVFSSDLADIMYGSDVTHTAEILDCLVDQKTSGQVKRASMILRCRLIPVAVHIEFNKYDMLEWRARPEWSSDSFTTISIDDPISVWNTIASLKVWLTILRSTNDGNGIIECDEGLAVVRSTHHPLGFERIGYFYTSDHALLKIHEKTEAQTIELV